MPLLDEWPYARLRLRHYFVTFHADDIFCLFFFFAALRCYADKRLF